MRAQRSQRAGQKTGGPERRWVAGSWARGCRGCSRRCWVVALLILLVACVVGPLLACYGPEYYSVHFTDARVDFFEMPQPWDRFPHEERALPGSGAYYAHEDVEYGYGVAAGWGYGTKRRLTPLDLAKQALRCEAVGRFRRAAALWARYRQERSRAYLSDYTPLPWEEPAQARGLEDRIAALQAWRSPRDTAALRTYLRARDLVNRGRYGEAHFLLVRLRREPYRTRAEYLQASIRFYTDTPEAAAAAYRALLKRHPRWPLALYMVGRCFFSPVREEEEIGLRFLAPERRRRYLREALAAYEACAVANPRTPLAADARGLAAACLLRMGDTVGALVRYCRLLAALPDGGDNHAAFLSARTCLRRMVLAEHRAFQARTLAQPELASIYLDLLLHYDRLGARAHYNLGLFALEVLKRRPTAPLSGRLLARLARIEGRLGRWKRAERLSAAAMERCAPGAYRDEARWQRAMALRQLQRGREALVEYERLSSRAVVAKMRRGAHEAAARLSEEMGDYPNAIRHYFALEYRLDYAYLIDGIASPDDLRAFLKRFPTHPQAKLVRYSLGFRQLRAGQYDAAARTFVALGPWLDVAEKKYNCATSKGKSRWPPLRVARFMAAATRREAAARSDGEKARVAYSRARLLFRQRHLVLYNGALWQGWRVWALEIHEPGGPYGGSEQRDPREDRAYRRYREEHTALFHALREFERIARKYSKTSEAPKALYSAALCYTLLSNLDSYWASEREVDYEGRAMQLYRRLQRDYPNDPLVPAAAQFGGALPIQAAAPPPPAQGGRGIRR